MTILDKSLYLEFAKMRDSALSLFPYHTHTNNIQRREATFGGDRQLCGVDNHDPFFERYYLKLKFI